MATYYSDVGGGATIFTGYTAASGSGCVSQSLTTAVASTAAVPHAPHKQVIKPASSAFCSSSVKMKITNSQPAGWWGAWSFAKPTAYTAAMQISPVSLNANFKKATGHKVWMDAYNSAGVVQASVQIGSRNNAGSTSISSIAVSTTKVVTVPVSGYFVLRIDYKPSTQKGSGKGEIKWGQTAATSGLKFVTTETPAITGPQATITATGAGGQATIVADVQLISVTHTFQSDAGTPLADGINVVAFEASTMSNANPTVVGNAAIAGGAGSVIVICSTTNPVILVPDHAHPSFPTGEVGHSPPITPTVA